MLKSQTFAKSRGGIFFEGPQKGSFWTLFDEKGVLIVDDKTPESDHESSLWEDQDGFCGTFRYYDVDGVRRLP